MELEEGRHYFGPQFIMGEKQAVGQIAHALEERKDGYWHSGCFLPFMETLTIDGANFQNRSSLRN